MANSDGPNVGAALQTHTLRGSDLWRRRPTIHLLLPILIAASVVFLTVSIYLPGLHGPFLLDDVGNLASVKRWLDGDLGWRGVIFDNRSGPGGRPLSMLSFLVDAWRSGGMTSFAFKSTNLVIHLLAGGMAFILARQILVRVGIGSRAVAISAALIATAWLWMPIQASTTLYVVQRMAQLAALLTFAALSVYMLARRGMLNHRRWGLPLLWIGTPLLTLLAALAKENGALALPLAAVLEYTLFKPGERSRTVRWFFAVTVGLPLLTALSFVLLRPEVITRGYAMRDFTLVERLLTEPRILWSYLQTSFFPVGPRMGLYHDNYPASTNLWNPLSTWVAVATWVFVVIVAFLQRKRMPLFLTGVIGYLVGLSLESGPISLELYFEHRNYGPLFFALIAATGVVLPVVGRFAMRPALRRMLIVVAGLLLASYAFGTWNQAQTWSDERTFNAVQYAYNPTSPRLLSGLTARAMLDHDLDKALGYIASSEANGPHSERTTSTLWRLLAYCEAVPKADIPASLYDELDARSQGRITTYAMVAWELLADRLARGCGDVARQRIATSGIHWLRASPQAARDQAMWRTRYNIGRIIADNGDLRTARALVNEAWLDSDKNNGIGVLLFQLNASLGDEVGCREVLTALERANSGVDKRLALAVRSFRHALDAGEIRSPTE